MSAIGREEDVVKPWQMSWRGRTWRDMPGGDETMQKCNFALWRRGLLESEESEDVNDILESGVRRLVPIHKGNGGARRVRARVNEERAERVAELEEKRRAEAELRRVQGGLQMRLTRWGHQRGALHQIAWRAGIDRGSLSQFRMTGRKISGLRAERLAAVLDDLDAGLWKLKDRLPRKKTVYEVPAGCVPFKAWLEAMGEVMGIAPHSVRVRALRGTLAMPEIIKINGRMWFVRREALPRSDVGKMMGGKMMGEMDQGLPVYGSQGLKVSTEGRAVA